MKELLGAFGFGICVAVGISIGFKFCEYIFGKINRRPYDD